MIESWAEKLAVTIKGANESETSSIAVMKYALTIVINFLIPYTAALLIGFITGKPLETAISVLAIILVRASSGGYHFDSSSICIIVTAAAAAIPPHITLATSWSLILTAVSLLLFLIFAPANIKGYAQMPEKYFPAMKLAASAVVASNFLLQYPFLSIIYFLQGISLLFTNNRR